MKTCLSAAQPRIGLCSYLVPGSFGFICRCGQDESEISANHVSLEKDNRQDGLFLFADFKFV